MPCDLNLMASIQIHNEQFQHVVSCKQCIANANLRVVKMIECPIKRHGDNDHLKGMNYTALSLTA